MLTPTEEQSRAIDAIYGWYTNRIYSQGPLLEFLLDGGAGVGKTTVAGMAVKALGLKPSDVLYGAYTAKAARVMAQKGMTDATTLHRLLYYPEYDKDGSIIGWFLNTDSRLKRAKLLVVDECSKVSERVAQDIRSFKVPTLILGDVDGQLPPPKDAGAFTNRRPDFRLTEPHRAALNSTIDRLAWTVRRGAQLRPMKTDDVTIMSMLDPDTWNHITNGDNMVICGKHKSRLAVTRRCRTKYGFEGPLPRPTEPLICCRNDYKQGFVNGELAVLWRISEINPDYFVADLLLDGETNPGVKISRSLFDAHFSEDNKVEADNIRQGAALFDWAYAITAHKAQGSEWDNVVVIDDKFAHWDHDLRRRWLYTAITRASQKLIVLQTGK